MQIFSKFFVCGKVKIVFCISNTAKIPHIGFILQYFDRVKIKNMKECKSKVEKCTCYLANIKERSNLHQYFNNYCYVVKLHIDGGARRVVITAPSVDAPMYVFGVNHCCYSPKKGAIVSATSCTTNCAGPLIKIMNEQFQVIEGMITSIHATTAAQKTVDGPTGKVIKILSIDWQLNKKRRVRPSGNSSRAGVRD